MTGCDSCIHQSCVDVTCATRKFVFATLISSNRCDIWEKPMSRCSVAHHYVVGVEGAQEITDLTSWSLMGVFTGRGAKPLLALRWSQRRQMQSSHWLKAAPPSLWWTLKLCTHWRGWTQRRLLDWQSNWMAAGGLGRQDSLYQHT